jgi:hypothetical protein
MKKLLFSLLTIAVLSGAFLAEAVAAFPPNDWQQLHKRNVRPDGN